MNIDVERSDYMHLPGRSATLTIGPFAFGIDTADGFRIAFGIQIGQWSASWTFERER